MIKHTWKTAALVITAAVVVGVALGLTNAVSTRAAVDAPVIGHVDGPRLNQEYPAMKTAWENINKQKATLERELNTRAEGQDEETRRRLHEQYNTRYNEYAKTQLEPAMKALNNALTAVAKERGVTVIVDSNVVHYGGIDLTDAVLKKVVR